MIDIAKKHEYELNKKYLDVIATDKLFWLHEKPYIKYNLEIHSDSWNHIQCVSIDSSNNIIGYFAGQLDRINNQVNNLTILNFGEANILFTIDCLRFVEKLKLMGFVKIVFSVIIGNPAEIIYDNIVHRLGGDKIGIFKNDVKLIDGKYYDRKFYEIQLIHDK